MSHCRERKADWKNLRGKIPTRLHTRQAACQGSSRSCTSKAGSLACLFHEAFRQWITCARGSHDGPRMCQQLAQGQVDMPPPRCSALQSLKDSQRNAAFRHTRHSQSSNKFICQPEPVPATIFQRIACQMGSCPMTCSADIFSLWRANSLPPCCLLTALMHD